MNTTKLSKKILSGIILVSILFSSNSPVPADAQTVLRQPSINITLQEDITPGEEAVMPENTETGVPASGERETDNEIAPEINPDSQYEEKQKPALETFDRFIIKYRNENKKEQFRQKLSESIKQQIPTHSGKFEVIVTRDKMDKNDFQSLLSLKQADEDIEYVQPDYRLDLSSSDPSYSSQWGLHSTVQVPVGGPPVREDEDNANNPVAPDKINVLMLQRDPLKLQTLLHAMRGLPIDEPQYRSALDGFMQNADTPLSPRDETLTTINKNKYKLI